MSTLTRETQACRACKQQKRKCDKAQPLCGLCQRTGRPCDYDSAVDAPPTAADIQALQLRLAELESIVSQGTTDSTRSSDFDFSMHIDPPGLATPWSQSTPAPRLDTATSHALAALFLDLDCYKWSGMSTTGVSIDIPLDVLSLLTEGDSVVDAYTVYFDTIHTWFPIISKKRIDLGIPVRAAGPEMALLILTMKLISAPFDDVANDPAYAAAKNFLRVLETSGCVSFSCLQAMVLIALYEHSHAIYPAAWMTIGVCARYAEMIGLTGKGDTLGVMPRVTTWSEAEERRRTWWGMYILDRVISTGSRRRFALAEAPAGSTLPSDDHGWDRGDALLAVNLPIETDVSVPQPPFARLCQSAMLLGRAIVSVISTETPSSRTVGALSNVSDQLLGFVSVIDSETANEPTNPLFLLNPRCLIGSALFLVLDIYTCPEKMDKTPGYNAAVGAKSTEEIQMQLWAASQINEMTRKFCTLSTVLTDTAQSLLSMHRLGRFPPLSLDTFYCTVATLYWYRKEGMEDFNDSALENITRFLRVVGKRWRLAAEYVAIGEHSDICIYG